MGIRGRKFPQVAVYGKSAGSGGPYVGPGDITSFNVWWGFRAYSAAKAGTKCIRVVRASDSTQMDINTLANGSLDAAALATFLASTTGKVVTMYDQVGTNDMTQATDANRPAVLANALNSSYGAFFNGTTIFLSSISQLAYGQPYSASFVAERTSGTSFSDVFSSDTSGGLQIGFGNSANTGLIFAGTVVTVPGVNDNAFHAVNLGINGASSIYQIDALTGTVNPGTSGMGSGSAFLGTALATGGNNLVGTILECGVINLTAISAGTASSLNSNQHAAYGGF